MTSEVTDPLEFNADKERSFACCRSVLRVAFLVPLLIAAV